MVVWFKERFDVHGRVVRICSTSRHPSLYTLHPVHIGQHRLEEAKSSKQAKLLRDFLYYFTTHAYKHVTSDVDCAQRSQTISR